MKISINDKNLIYWIIFALELFWLKLFLQHGMPPRKTPNYEYNQIETFIGVLGCINFVIITIFIVIVIFMYFNGYITFDFTIYKSPKTPEEEDKENKE